LLTIIDQIQGLFAAREYMGQGATVT